MIGPKAPGTPVNLARYRHWLASFSSYRDPVTQATIENWLAQFSDEHQDLAARILDSVLFITNQKIRTDLRDLVNSIDGWHRARIRRGGRFFFVAFSGSTGESGDVMLHTLRDGLMMSSRRYNDLFIHRSELVAKKLRSDDTVVLVDDFSGTGEQARKAWKLFETLLVGGPRTILILVAATDVAIGRIRDETDLDPHCTVRLRDRDNLFNPACAFFSEEDKQAILGYCQRADHDRPRGFGDCGLLVVLAHKTPNNSIPILHRNSQDWQSLFPRYG